MVEISAPFLASVEIVNSCNLDCKYCYSWPFHGAIMSQDYVARVTDLLVSKGVFTICYEGGEPLLHPNIEKILRNTAMHRGVDFSVLSNGTIWKDEVWDVLEDQSENLRLQISLDSIILKQHNEVRGLGKEILGNLEKLAKRQMRLSIGIVIHKSNIQSAEKIIDRFYPDIKQYHFMNLMPSRRTVENWHFLLPDPKELRRFWSNLSEKVRRIPDLIVTNPEEDSMYYQKKQGSCSFPGCAAGFTRVHINANGQVLACEIDKGSLMGDLREDSFDNIWFSSRAEDIRSRAYPLCSMNLKPNKSRLIVSCH